MNFRDLGGIPAYDGLHVKPGLLFRSGDLHSISDEDAGKLANMQLATVIDLRAQREIERRPDRHISTVKNIIHIDIHDAARDKAEKFLENNDAKGLETVLIGDYIRMVDLHQDDFRKFLRILATTADLPLVYHCAAGKDRTGLATVFLLTALGIHPDRIWEDYMVTNKYIAAISEKIISKVSASGKNGKILLPLLEVRREYLQSAIDQIDQNYNGMKNFVEHVLEADIPVLREKYLTF
jgi:protein-tyrosine phosphatase